ncbi:precorrin-6y C5,15-methyltransferase (decarboxylating) subunit CbiE [Thermincola potens]|uniref:precorrin-6y C5,15-methyltransferase (decarboxylating) subunit CbiE n=1 Tax=Thermincola potens TaxID=863643 RepID=UPI0005A1002C|nr:precorrin-6y C5,15-methyltransferase (decarboxylating) subunit CbiE [Thermincola potens]
MEDLLTVVGVGPGSESYLTPLARQAIDEAEVIVAGERLLEAFAGEGKSTFVIKNNLEDVVNFIKKNLKEKKVAVLASGDPGMYGILNFLLRHFSPEQMEVIPGISSVQLACARLRISWHDAVITSVHGREIKGLVDLVRNHDKVITLTDYRLTPAVVAQELIAAGVVGKKVWVCQNLSYSNEFVREFSLESLAKSPGYPGSVMVIVNYEHKVGGPDE